MVTNNCRVCGFYHKEKPWGEDGQTPLFEYCECCNVEFGYRDYSLESTLKFRKRWFDDGAKWSDKKTKPINWDLEEQLKSIPRDFL